MFCSHRQCDGETVSSLKKRKEGAKERWKRAREQAYKLEVSSEEGRKQGRKQELSRCPSIARFWCDSLHPLRTPSHAMKFQSLHKQHSFACLNTQCACNPTLSKGFAMFCLVFVSSLTTIFLKERYIAVHSSQRWQQDAQSAANTAEVDDVLFKALQKRKTGWHRDTGHSKGCKKFKAAEVEADAMRSKIPAKVYFNIKPIKMILSPCSS